MVSSFRVVNVKYHFRASNIQIPLKNVKEKTNFKVVSFQKLKLTIFPKSGFVNVCGVKNFENLSQSVCLVNSCLQTTISERDITVDNSTASGRLKLPQYFGFTTLRTRVEYVNSAAQVSIQPHFFPGAIIRSQYPTTILFLSGNFIIVGGKNLQDIKKSYNQLCAIIQE